MSNAHKAVAVKVKGSGMSDSAVKAACRKARTLALRTGVARVVYGWGRDGAFVHTRDARCKSGVRVVHYPAQ